MQVGNSEVAHLYVDENGDTEPPPQGRVDLATFHQGSACPACQNPTPDETPPWRSLAPCILANLSSNVES